MPHTIGLHDQHRYVGAATTQEEIDAIAAASVLEARNKEERIKAFYEQPSKNSAPWHLPLIHWEYLRQWKPEGKKRKDKATEDILHEANPILETAVHYKAGYLPDEVTYEVIQGQKSNLPPEQRPISNLFSTFAFHDVDEEDPDSSKDTLIEFSNDRISDLDEVREPEKEFMRAQTLFLAEVSDAITFGRKTRDAKGKVIKVKTHSNDLGIYTPALKALWPAFTAKCPDREKGLVTRFTRVAVPKFTIDKTMSYLNETGTLFMDGQPIEDTMERFPQLSSYLDIMNARLRIAYVVMRTMANFHPELDQKRYSRKGVADPNTAEVNIRRHLTKAMTVAPWTHPDVCSMAELLEGITAEADRYPVLQPIVDSVEEQLSPYLQQLGSKYHAQSHLARA